MRRLAKRSAVVAIVVVVTASFLLSASSATAASTSQQRRDIRRAATAIRTAERMEKAGRNDDAVKSFTEAQDVLVEVANGLDEKLKRSFDRTVEQLGDAHAALKKKGLELPALASISATMAERGTPNLGSSGGNQGAMGEVSFAADIAPVLVSFCGRCHVDESRGGFSMANYNALMAAGVVEKGAGFESEIVGVIAGGSMPPSGDGPSPEQTKQLVTWINQGAKFDGDNPSQSLRDLKKGTATPTPDQPKMNVPKPKGGETVSFALDVAPILAQSCYGCHGDAQPRSGLSVADFARLWKGGDKGNAIVPGKPDQSLLIQKLNGTAKEGRRMPLNRPPLSKEKIEVVAKWIREGATFDGSDPATKIQRVTALARSGKASPEELSESRKTEAHRKWHLAVPDEKAAEATSQRFYVLGNLPERQLTRVAALAEAEVDRVRKFFRQPDEALNKARITLYSFRSRIDYAEFGTMVERRDLPRSMDGHAKYDLVYPYMAVVVASPDDEGVQRELAQHIASLFVANQAAGRLPEWFIDGSGRAAAAHLWAKDKAVKQWDDQLHSSIAALRNPDDFMTGKLGPAESNLLSYGYVDAILKRPGNFNKLVKLVGEGKSMDEASQAVFKRSQKELAELWVASKQRGR